MDKKQTTKPGNLNLVKTGNKPENKQVPPYTHPFSKFMKTNPPANASRSMKQYSMRVPRRKVA